MANVIQLAEANIALAPTADDLAERLEMTARQLREGRYGDVERVLVVLSRADGAFVRHYGPPVSRYAVAGLLAYTQHEFIAHKTLDDSDMHAG